MIFKKYSKQPNIGDRVKLTWLPYNNAWPDKNCYIGWEGVVDYLFDNGGFCMDCGGRILIVTRKYRYEKVN